MTTAWAHLPNAAHIDSVIASVLSNPVQWTETRSTVQDAERVPGYNEAWGKARNAARNAARDAVRGKARDAAWYKAWNAATDVSWHTIWDTLLALIAYDDCAYMIDSDPSELAILAAFGDPRAILLLSACKVFHSIKEVV